MRALGRLVLRRPWHVLVATAVFVVVAGTLGSSVIPKLSPGGFNEPGAESSRAADELEERFGTGSPNIILLVTAREGTVDDPAVVEAGTALTEELAGVPDVVEAQSYWSLGSVAPLRSDDSRRALVLGRIPGDETAVQEASEDLPERFERSDDVVTVELGGASEVFRAISEQSEKDLQRAELISFPVTLVLLIAVFGGVVAAALPLAVAAVAVVGTLLLLLIFTTVTEVSVFALNLTTGMGLGLAIDYSLFIVSRYREELQQGRERPAALLRTMQTAGRTIAFSALTVAVSLSAMLVFPTPFLRSFAYAGIGVVGLAAVGALVLLPALLVVLGPRVDALTLWRREPKPVGEGVWHRVARAVMRRPIPVAVTVIAFLLVLGQPFLHLELTLPDDRVLREDAPVREVNDALREEFASGEANALGVVTTDLGDAGDADIEAFAAAASALDGVARVDARSGYYIDGAEVLEANELSERFADDDGEATWFSVVPDIEPVSAEGEALVEDLRAIDAPFEVLVGGRAAELVDGKASLFSRLPYALLVIAITTFVLLFLMVGSLLVPAKALVLNLLSLTATFGAMVWVFQDGNLSSVLGFTATGGIDLNTPVLMFCVAFGLSMDYEVFLLSRIKEEYDIDQDNESAVAIGLERTGRIVTAAAILLAVVFLAFATSSVSVVQLIGLGLALAVLVDAFLIRGTLVPAFMRLAGRANWWAPKPLRRIHLRFGVWETEPLSIVERAEDQKEQRERALVYE